MITQAEIIMIEKVFDEVSQDNTYQIIITTKNMPALKLGGCEVKQ